MKDSSNSISSNSEETDQDIVVHVLANLYDTAKSSVISKQIENKEISIPSSGSDSDDRRPSKKRTILSSLTEEERIEEERKEKRREKDRIRKRIQREKQRREKQLQLQAKAQAGLRPNREPGVPIQSYFKAFFVPPGDSTSYGFLLPFPSSNNLVPYGNCQVISDPIPLEAGKLRLPPFSPFYVNNRVMS